MRSICFILNNETIETSTNPAVVVLDYIRKKRLTGAKEGCKEGDCGACTVLTGELIDNRLVFKSINSCLMPLGNAAGKHLVTVEALNLPGKILNPIQQAFAEEGASQCGFCTPGFIVSLTGFFLNSDSSNFNKVIDALDGNICRCTGHNSIIRAAEKLSIQFKNSIPDGDERLKFLIDERIIPEYFLNIENRLKQINSVSNGVEINKNNNFHFIGGGTDIFVQKPDEVLNSEIILLKDLPEQNGLNGITEINGYCFIGSRSSVTDILESNIFKKCFPQLLDFIELFGSTPIRNGATLGGNINNASPIGDMTNFFLALNSTVILRNGKSERKIPLNKYYLSYKKTDKKPFEYMHSLSFKIPEGNYFFNFEKVSKRTYLDIASVNSSILLNIENDIITNAHLSAGGVSAIPLYLFKTSDYLTGESLNIDNIHEAVSIALSEISPISDARGTAEYKKLLLSRLIYTHFITLFPHLISIEETV
ncbi:MAG: FAD binding domain-containing protein [Ignavibacteria bacterium]